MSRKSKGYWSHKYIKLNQKDYYNPVGVAAEMEVEIELERIRETYILPEHVLKRIYKTYKYEPGKAGVGIKNLNILYSILSDYGYNKEEFSKYMGANAELVKADPSELVRKIIIFNAQGMLDTVLFSHAYALLKTEENLSSSELYSLGKHIKENNQEISYETLLATKYKLTDIKEYCEKYPLDHKTYKIYKQYLEISRKKRRRENNPEMVMKKTNSCEE